MHIHSWKMLLYTILDIVPSLLLIPVLIVLVVVQLQVVWMKKERKKERIESNEKKITARQHSFESVIMRSVCIKTSVERHYSVRHQAKKLSTKPESCVGWIETEPSQ